MVYAEKGLLHDPGVGIIQIADTGDFVRQPRFSRNHPAGDHVYFVGIGDAHKILRLVDSRLAQGSQLVTLLIDHQAVQNAGRLLGLLRILFNQHHVFVFFDQLLRELKPDAAGP